MYSGYNKKEWRVCNNKMKRIEGEGDKTFVFSGRKKTIKNSFPIYIFSTFASLLIIAKTTNMMMTMVVRL
jgi:hypothetical protein